MPTIRLTEKSIARLAAPDPSGRQMLYWDDDLKGFGVLVSGTTNSKSYIVQRALPDGTRRRVTIARTNVIKLDEAVGKAKRLLAEFYNGQDPKALRRGDATLRSALSDYVAARSDLKASSAAYYELMVNSYLEPWLDAPLRSITREMVEERLRKIAKDVAAKARHSGNATANGAMRAFRVMYNHAADRAPADDPMPPNPVRLKKVWLPVKARTRKVQSDDMKKFYQAACGLENQVAADYLKLVLFTGMRRREAAGMLWAHVDLPARIIRLPAESTKPGRALDLPMSDFIYELLVARHAAAGDTRWLFPANSASGHLEEPKSQLKEIADASGVKVSVHDLRRTFVTVAESLDISTYALKALVNHALGNDVTAGYIQMDPERLRAPMQRVTDRLKVLCGIA
jgi:integrase